MPLQPPPVDNNGNVVLHDHEGITPNDGIIRRISEQQIISVNGKRKISSMAFKASSGVNAGMSVDLQALIEEAGIDPHEYVTTPRWIGSVRFEAGSLRQAGFRIGYHPLPENPYHGEVRGDFTKAQQHRLQQLAIWFVQIPDVIILAA